MSWFVKFYSDLSFFIIINPLKSCFSLMKFGTTNTLNNFLYHLQPLCQIRSLNFPLIYQIWHCFLILHFVFWYCCLLFLLALTIMYCVQYMILRMLIVWIPICCYFFYLLILGLKTMLSFYEIIWISFLFSLGIIY